MGTALESINLYYKNQLIWLEFLPFTDIGMMSGLISEPLHDAPHIKQNPWNVAISQRLRVTGLLTRSEARYGALNRDEARHQVRPPSRDVRTQQLYRQWQCMNLRGQACLAPPDMQACAQ